MHLSEMHLAIELKPGQKSKGQMITGSRLLYVDAKISLHHISIQGSGRPINIRTLLVKNEQCFYQAALSL